jgi:8-oxo-dGTP diphosphatase
MSHLHTDDGYHDLTVSAFIVRLDTAEPALMLHRHKKLGHYLHFGGHVEWHENPWQALVREIQEESGYAMSQLKILQPKARLAKLTAVSLHPVPVSFLTHKFPGIDHYHTDLAFAFITDQKPKHQIGQGESDDIKLCTAAELRQLPSDLILDNIREIGLYVLEDCLHNWQRLHAPKA